MARKMRDSGVEWIGEVPEGWEVARLKSLFSYGKGLAITKADLVPEGVPVISYGQIHAKTNSGTHLQDALLRHVSVDYLQTDGDCLLKKNDFVFADTSEDLEGLGNCAFVDRDDKIFAGYHTIVFHPKCDMPSKYLAYLFKTDCWRSQFRAKAYGIKVYSLSQRLLNDCSVVLPQEQEAERIADYLDEKCAAIDGAVCELKRGIEDCKAWKKAIIFEAVTGKANVLAAKNAKVAKRQMRDSGIPWIGEIPEGWEVKPLRRLGRLANGISKGGEYFGKGFPFVSYSDVYKNDAIPTQVKGLVEANDQERERYSVKRGDVFFTRTSETVDEIGIAAACLKDIQDSTFAGFLIRFRPMTDELLPEFSKYYFRNKLVSEYFAKELVMVTRASLGQELLKSLPVFIPPMKEQQAIADYLDEKCAAIDALVAEKEKLIADLEAYKKSLIFELVTGKREVA